MTFIRRTSAARTLEQVSKSGGGGAGGARETGGVEPRYVAHVTAGQVVLVDASTTLIHLVTDGVATSLGKHTSSRVAVSPDGTQLAYSDADDADQLKVFTLATEVTVPLAVQPAGCYQPAFNPTGEYVAFQISTTGTLLYALPSDGKAADAEADADRHRRGLGQLNHRSFFTAGPAPAHGIDR